MLVRYLATLGLRLRNEPLTVDAELLHRGPPVIVRLTYAAFLTADHEATGGLLLDHHLPDATVLCAYPEAPETMKTRRNPRVQDQ